MNSSEKSLTFDNCTFLFSKDVYEPSEDTFLLADSFQAKETDTVLDMGTGCGIIGILIAKKVKDVVAIDINRQAVRCARTNAKLNEVSEKMSFLTADLFQSIKVTEEFDLIVFNAPYLPSEKEEQEIWIGRAWAGGPSGRQVIDKFVNDAPNYLKNDGRILLVQSTLSNVSKTLRKLERAGLEAEVIAEKKEAFETIVVIKAIRQLKKRSHH